MGKRREVRPHLHEIVCAVVRARKVKRSPASPHLYSSSVICSAAPAHLSQRSYIGSLHTLSNHDRGRQTFAALFRGPGIGCRTCTSGWPCVTQEHCIKEAYMAAGSAAGNEPRWSWRPFLAPESLLSQMWASHRPVLLYYKHTAQLIQAGAARITLKQHRLHGGVQDVGHPLRSPLVLCVHSRASSA